VSTSRDDEQSGQLSASVQELPDALAVRIHPHNGQLGDPYVWSCVVVPEGAVAVIQLVGRAPTRAERRALVQVLQERGFATARWERRRGGNSRWTREFRR
jgi:hypothetical protein